MYVRKYSKYSILLKYQHPSLLLHVIHLNTNLISLGWHYGYPFIPFAFVFFFKFISGPAILPTLSTLYSHFFPSEVQ